MTQIEAAKKNQITSLMLKVSAKENIPPQILCKKVSQGRIVIPKNKNHKIKRICGIGEGLTTKVNANLGTSTDKVSLKAELKKLKIAIEAGADTVMDLSVGGNLKAVRREILRESSVPVGTVPIYEAAVEASRINGSILKMSKEQMLSVIESQAAEGVDFFTIHCGITEGSLSLLKKHKRILDIVSRGGAILATWMSFHHQENPFYENFDEILKICYKYDVTLSLGDSLRPGSIIDATDKLQIKELSLLGKLAKRAREFNVGVMIEGPGHIPINQIQKNVLLEKKLCGNAPFYVLGPLVTDVAAGYDHITAAIGGALAASFGADFLCYVTASEHLRHPSYTDVKEGVVAAKIAAHAGDIAKGIKNATNWDRSISLARKIRDWKKQIKLSIDPVKAKLYRYSSLTDKLDVCSMCGDYCSLKMAEECLR
ncbi:MAG: phosphomethylpyrimidine synthase ThiC [Candidatus Omnitrophota bacterium]|nr:phosphomethylpyrimidine synthase ThiC [Candidatus Omnitrophota bacterium]